MSYINHADTAGSGGPFLPLAGGTMTGAAIWGGTDGNPFLTSAAAAG